MMYAALNYIQTHHPYGDIPGQPSQAPEPALITPPSDHPPVNGLLANGTTTTTTTQRQQQTNGTTQPPAAEDTTQSDPNNNRPDRPEAFHHALRELAQGLVLQEQQIELLINSLPGLGNSEASQLARMRELEVELREVEAERARAEEEREGLVEVLGQLVGRVGRVG